MDDVVRVCAQTCPSEDRRRCTCPQLSAVMLTAHIDMCVLLHGTACYYVPLQQKITQQHAELDFAQRHVGARTSVRARPYTCTYVVQCGFIPAVSYKANPNLCTVFKTKQFVSYIRQEDSYIVCGRALQDWAYMYRLPN